MPVIVKLLVFGFGTVLAIYGFVQLIGESRRPKAPEPEGGAAKDHSVQFLGLELHISSTPVVLVIAGIAAMVVPWGIAQGGDDNSSSAASPPTAPAATVTSLAVDTTLAAEPSTTSPPSEPAPPTETVAPTETAATIRVEAEDAALIAPMAARSDPDASGGAVVSSPETGNGTLRFDFSIETAGRYTVWARVATGAPLVAATDSNSFSVKLDNIGLDVWDLFEDQIDPAVGLQWEQISLRCGGSQEQHLCNPWTLDLDVGDHSLTVVAREPNATLDAIVISSDATFDPRNDS